MAFNMNKFVTTTHDLSQDSIKKSISEQLYINVLQMLEKAVDDVEYNPFGIVYQDYKLLKQLESNMEDSKKKALKQRKNPQYGKPKVAKNPDGDKDMRKLVPRKKIANPNSEAKNAIVYLLIKMVDEADKALKNDANTADEDEVAASIMAYCKDDLDTNPEDVYVFPSLYALHKAYDGKTLNSYMPDVLGNAKTKLTAVIKKRQTLTDNTVTELIFNVYKTFIKVFAAYISPTLLFASKDKTEYKYDVKLNKEGKKVKDKDGNLVYGKDPSEVPEERTYVAASRNISYKDLFSFMSFSNLLIPDHPFQGCLYEQIRDFCIVQVIEHKKKKVADKLARDEKKRLKEEKNKAEVTDSFVLTDDEKDPIVTDDSDSDDDEKAKKKKKRDKKKKKVVVDSDSDSDEEVPESKKSNIATGKKRVRKRKE